MKLPKIHTKHKIRDAAICNMYVKAEHTIKEIAIYFKLSVSRINALVYKNQEYIKVNTSWEKGRRIHWLKRQIAKNDDTKKDTADLMEQLRKEIEGDKPLVDQSIHTHLTKVEVKVSNDTAVPLTRKTGVNSSR